MQFTRADLDAATAVVRRVMPPTPTYEWPLLSTEAGATVLVKHENHTPVGAFKVRGGLVYVDRLRRERPHVRGLVSATRGNHGQSLALAGTRAGLDVTIVVPHGNSPAKNAAMRALGATLVEHGHDFQAARERAAELADASTELVPSFHPDLMLGVATYALELFDAAGPLDAVFVPVGMGSGACALVAVRDLLGLPTRIVGVVAERADATLRSVRAGRAVATDSADTFVDGVATRSPDAAAVEVLLAGRVEIVAVTEDEAAQAMRLMFATTRNAAEPAGALALAGLMRERPRWRDGRVGVVHTGGNVDADLLQEVLAGGTPAPAH